MRISILVAPFYRKNYCKQNRSQKIFEFQQFFEDTGEKKNNYINTTCNQNNSSISTPTKLVIARVEKNYMHENRVKLDWTVIPLFNKGNLVTSFNKQ